MLARKGREEADNNEEAGNKKKGGMRQRVIVLVGICLVLLAVQRVVPSRWETLRDWFRKHIETPAFALDELALVVAISTFLVGFEANRLQIMVSDWKEGVSRGVDRVLQRNVSEGLLPIPQELEEMSPNIDFADQKFDTSERIRMVILVLFLGSSLFLVLSQIFETPWIFQLDFDLSLVLLQLLHLFICVIGWSLLDDAKEMATEFKAKQPYDCYNDFKNHLAKYVKECKNGKQPSSILYARLRESADKLDESLPQWCWLTLVKRSYEVLQDDKWPEDKSDELIEIERIKECAKEAKNHDKYSGIAFVWSSYLTKKTHVEAHLDDISKVEELQKDNQYAQMAILIKNKNEKNRDKEQSGTPTGAIDIDTRSDGSKSADS